MPEAPPSAVEAVVDQVTNAAGAETTMNLGKRRSPSTLSQPEAAAAVANILARTSDRAAGIPVGEKFRRA
jgi:hypothetical protein